VVQDFPPISGFTMEPASWRALPVRFHAPEPSSWKTRPRRSKPAGFWKPRKTFRSVFSEGWAACFCWRNCWPAPPEP
jgi:hypothetical protein